MSEAEVRQDGPHGQRPGREATPGAKGGRRRGEQTMVPEASFTSYYGRPIIKQPTWEARDIAGYLFLGGLAGASSVLAAAAELSGHRRLARGAKVGALGAISLSTAALIHDLGRPERFVNMLRVMKLTSPMSVGSWILSVYGPAAGAAAVTDLTGLFPRLGRTATAIAALAGPAVATYTAVLIADTAVPAWHEAHREMPFLFAGSSAAAAGGLGLILAPRGPARATAIFGALLELGTGRLMRHRLGPQAKPYDQPLTHIAEAATAAGAGLALLSGRRWLPRLLAGAGLLAGSALTRFAVFEAGRRSAADPQYTVLAQRRPPREENTS